MPDTLAPLRIVSENMDVNTYAELVKMRQHLLAIEKENQRLKKENAALKQQVEELKDESMSLFSFISSKG